MARILLRLLAPNMIERLRAHVPFAHYDYWPLIILALLLLSPGFAVNTRAQGMIIVIAKGRKPIRTPTSQITRIPGSTRNAEPIGALPMNVQIGDELVGNDDAVTVKVRCNNSAELALSGKFRVRFLRATGRDCNLHFYGTGGASMIVNASDPTNIQSGETKLASRRTSFEVRIPGNSTGTIGALQIGDAMPDVLVYKDEVAAESPVFRGTIKEGTKLTTEGTSRPAITKLGLEDFHEAAIFLAELDVSQALQCETCAEFGPDAYAKLVNLHQQNLEDPHDQTKVAALQEALKKYRISDNEIVSGLTLTPGEKRIVPVGFDNECTKPIKVRATLSNVSISRLVTAADGVARPHAWTNWQLELNATGLPPGIYAAEVTFSCLDCPKQKCSLTSQVARVSFIVRNR